MIFLCKQECKLSTDVDSSHFVRGGWRPLPGLICELFYIYLVREILHLSGKGQGISKSCGCGNHEKMANIKLTVLTCTLQESSGDLTYSKLYLIIDSRFLQESLYSNAPLYLYTIQVPRKLFIFLMKEK